MIERDILDVQAKREIAEAASELFTKGDSVTLGAGSTVAGTYQQMIEKDRTPGAIVTNSLQVTRVPVPKGIQLRVVGELYDEKAEALVDTVAQQRFLHPEYRSNQAVVSVAGVVVDGGDVIFSVSHLKEKEVTAAILKNARRRLVILANHTALGIDKGNMVGSMKELVEQSIDRSITLVTNDFKRWKSLSEDETSSWKKADGSRSKEAKETLEALEKLVSIGFKIEYAKAESIAQRPRTGP